MNKDIVVLANSRKLSGRCVAGKDGDGNWIRLTKNSHNPIPIGEADNWDMLNVMHVTGIVNTPSRNFRYHSENVIYNRATVTRQFNTARLDELLDNPNSIFGIGSCLSEAEAQRLENSLLFVRVMDLCIYFKDYGQYGYKVRGRFTYNNITYTDISVTDSSVESQFSHQVYPYEEIYDEAYITVSLGEIFRGSAYKLISGVII